MKFFSAVIVSLLSVPVIYGQLTVKPSASLHDSYLYVNGGLLYVNQNVNLQKNADASPTEASIYLRREGQLIQGPGNFQNEGDGMLSVFQEGTSNGYDYNYWSAPVGDGGPGNGKFGIGMLYAPENLTSSKKAIVTNGLDGVARPLTISSRWIYTFSGMGYSNWQAVYGATSIPAGKGFSMKGVNGMDMTQIDGRANNPGSAQRYDFRGKPNNGDISISVKAGEQVLVGNPFPSALDLSLFLLENSGSGSMESDCYGNISRNPATTGIAYFWDSVENGTSHYLQDYVGGYGAFSPVDPCTTGIYEKPVFRTYASEENIPTGAMGAHYDRRYLPIAQGFMVRTASSTPIEFRNSQRIFKKEGEHSVFRAVAGFQKERALTAIPKVRLEAVINDSYRRSLTLAFWPTATPGTDAGMDAKGFDLAPTDVGWLLNEQSYVIDVRPFSAQEEIPLFLKVDDAQASLKIEVAQLEEADIEELYIYDALYGIYFPILESSFRVTLKKGIYHERFRICFTDRSKIVEKEHGPEGLEVFQDNREGRLKIFNREHLSIQAILLFDLEGKELVRLPRTRKDFSSFATSGFANSVYIVRVLLEDEREFVRKVQIYNPY